jgi:hypothetical protein
MAEGITATLGSIRRQKEEGSGKVEAPPPAEGAEPQLEENPAVVDEDSPPDSLRGKTAVGSIHPSARKGSSMKS